MYQTLSLISQIDLHYSQILHYIKTVTLDNEEFASNVSQFDLLVKESDTNDDILTVEEVIMANYEQIIGTGM